MTYSVNLPMRTHWQPTNAFRRGLVRRAILSLFCLLGALALFPQTVFAHPMGNFSVNHYSRLSLTQDGVAVLYIVDMAEIPTHAERTIMDIDGDQEISSAEEQSYLESFVASLPSQLPLTLNGEPATWTTGEHRLLFKAGQANLPTLRMEVQLSAALPATAANGPVNNTGNNTANNTDSNEVRSLQYQDNSYPDRLGWREVIVAPGSDVQVVASDVPQSDLSNMLQEYPVDLLQNPPKVTTANLSWQPVAAQAGQQLQQTAGEAKRGATSTNLAGDGFAQLVSIEFGPWAIVLALLAAFGWGAAHALSPGHGKTIVAAYLVGARGTFIHAIFLGATTTITHTFGVFVLGLATLLASQYILPERIYPWLSTISGLLVITIGISIGWGRLRGLLRKEAPAHAHDHAHDDLHVHTHDSHSHDSHSDHSHSDHSHSDHSHSHGGQTHSHLPVSVDGTAISWRGLLALGISGGLLPCPSALVVLLGSIALGRVGFGLLLILVFSLGLASVLTAFGLLLLRAGKLFERIPESSRYARYLAVASAAFITLVGVGITVQALIAMGLFPTLA